jgi:FADH2 O2-dependent halogenase
VNEHVTPRYDVAVLGSHLATALLAAVLSRNGLRVAMVRTGLDAELPAGETTVPYTAELFHLLGTRFDVPEITAMSRFDELPPEVKATSGAKLNLGFLYHRAGDGQRRAEALQFEVPSEHAEWHLYRPDVDRHAEQIARANGTVVFGAPPLAGGVHAGPDGVRIELRDGLRIDAQYLVDGSGDPALLPEGVAGPDGARMRHRARLLTAELAKVAPAEAYLPCHEYGDQAAPWSTGTLTHVFAGGWLQIVPFGMRSPTSEARCGVTLSLDPERYPPTGEEPAAEFQRRIAEFPDIERAFVRAIEVRPWRRHDDWPALAPVCSGPRWFLFDRSAGRQDLVLSRDVTTSLELVHGVATGLLGMAGSGDWQGSGMAATAAFQRRVLEFQDQLMCAARIATDDFALWNAYLRVWLLWTILCALSVKRARLDGVSGSGRERWSPVERFHGGPYWYQVPAGLPELVGDALADLEAVRSGGGADAADAMFSRLRAEPFVPPLYDFGDPEARYYVFGPERREQMAAWVEESAPPDFRRLLTEDNVTGVPSRI